MTLATKRHLITSGVIAGLAAVIGLIIYAPFFIIGLLVLFMTVAIYAVIFDIVKYLTRPHDEEEYQKDLMWRYGP